MRGHRPRTDNCFPFHWLGGRKGVHGDYRKYMDLARFGVAERAVRYNVNGTVSARDGCAYLSIRRAVSLLSCSSPAPSTPVRAIGLGDDYLWLRYA